MLQDSTELLGMVHLTAQATYIQQQQVNAVLNFRTTLIIKIIKINK